MQQNKKGGPRPPLRERGHSPPRAERCFSRLYFTVSFAPPDFNTFPFASVITQR